MPRDKCRVTSAECRVESDERQVTSGAPSETVIYRKPHVERGVKAIKKTPPSETVAHPVHVPPPSGGGDEGFGIYSPGFTGGFLCITPVRGWADSLPEAVICRKPHVERGVRAIKKNTTVGDGGTMISINPNHPETNPFHVT